MIFNTARVAAQLMSLQRSQWWPAARIRQYQETELLRILRFAITSVPYYRSLGIGVAEINSPADLRRFPLLTKSIFQTNQRKLLADGTSIESCETSSTSGSTGEPTTTAFDKRSWLLCKYALKIRRLLAFGVGLGKRVLLVSELHPNEIAASLSSGMRGQGLLFGQTHVSIHEPVTAAIPILQEYRPHAVYSFPSYLAELLEHCERHDVSLPKLDVIFSSSEVLGDALRKRLSESFGAVVCDVYGSTEFKEVAWQCHHGSYHINFESTWVETEDNHDGVGTILLTTLVNRAMPLVRYRVGDLGRLGGGSCACGREGPWIEPVSGREIDMLALPDGRRLSPYLLTSVVETDAGIRRYQIVQISPTRLEVRYISLGPDDVNEIDLSKLLAALLGEQMQLQFRRVSDLPRTTGGKQQVFCREFDSPVES